MRTIVHIFPTHSAAVGAFRESNLLGLRRQFRLSIETETELHLFTNQQSTEQLSGLQSLEVRLHENCKLQSDQIARLNSLVREP